jgi:sugar lactone lactonase YvrE
MLFSGSQSNGDVLAVDVVTGERHLVVDAPPGRIAAGLKQDRWGRLWVAGGAAGEGYVYDADGAPVRTLSLGAPGTTFVNDVVLTTRAAWFTDSFADVLYRVPLGTDGAIGKPVAVALSGDYRPAPGFNLNGIEATSGDRWLLAVQTNTGRLYRIDPQTGESTAVDLGGVTLAWGDGILLEGRRLYVVQNFLNKVAVVDLGPRDFTTGRVVSELTSAEFDVPTAVVRFGNRLYLPNARFTTPPTAETPYDIVSVELR